jgi:uncharacterized membrane protein
MFRHPVHRTLIVFPLGLLGTSFFFDIAWLLWGKPELGLVARWLILAGVAGGVLASIFGLLDWLQIPRGTRARSIGALHGTGNLVVAILFAASWLLRGEAPEHPGASALALSAAGVILTVMTGWLGGQLVDRLAGDEEGSPHAAGTP